MNTWNRHLLVRLVVLIAIMGFPKSVTAQVATGKMTPADPILNIGLGGRLASTAGWVFSGTPSDSTLLGNAGAVNAFAQGIPVPPQTQSWSQVQKIYSPDPALGDVFGEAVAAWGEWLFITAPQDDPGGMVQEGAAYAYHLENGTWEFWQKILPDDIALGSTTLFGSSVAFDGNTLVIGAHHDNSKKFEGGSAYVFEFQGGLWTQTAKLYAQPAQQGAAFGWSVAVDGDSIVIGAAFEDVLQSDDNLGAAYTFERIGGVWIFGQRLLEPDPQDVYAPNSNDFYGQRVGVSGQSLVVSANIHSHSVQWAGAVYAYRKLSGSWILEQELLAPDPLGNQSLGVFLAMRGNQVLAGAPYNGDFGLSSGGAYLWERQPTGVWVQKAKMLDPASRPSAFGVGVSFLDDDAVFVGAYSDQENCPANQFCNTGVIYVFEHVLDAVQYCSCSGVGPCGNHDEFGGCANSTSTASIPQGGVLAAAGTASVLADDLLLEARWLPASVPAILFMGGTTKNTPFGDGRLCVAPGSLGLFRFLPAQSSGSGGVITYGPGVVGLTQSLPPPAHVQPGQTWHFQAWFRDPQGPCGQGFNTSNAVRVAFQP